MSEPGATNKKGATIMRRLAWAILWVAIPYHATANDTDITGMYSLVSEQRKIVGPGWVVPWRGFARFHLLR